MNRRLTSTVASALITLTASWAQAQGGPEALPPPPPPLAPPVPAASQPATPAPIEEAGVLAQSAAPPAADSVPESASVLPSLYGPAGLFRMSTTDTGPKNHFRFSLNGEYFSSKSFLVDGDKNQRLQGGFTFGFTPMENFEIFAAITGSSNRNQRTVPNEVNRRDPEYIKSFGDFTIGPKLRFAVSPAADFGVELGIKFLSSISGLSFDTDSTSLWIGPLFSYDLRKVNGTALRLHANLNYYVDNSKNVNPYSGAGDFTNYTRQVGNFAYGIAGSRVRVAVGADAPLASAPLTPFAEYHLEYVTADPDKNFAGFMSPNCGSGAGQFKCQDNRDMHYFTFGVRARVWKVVTLNGGLDVSPRSVGFPYGPPLAPWNLIFGFAVPLDVEAMTKIQVVEKVVEKPVPTAMTPPEGFATGMVKSAKGNAPVAGAIVAVVGKAQARTATDPDGTFRTIGVAPGAVELEVSAPGFESAKLSTTVALGIPVPLDVVLTPRAANGNVRGTVKDPTGKAIEGAVRFTGPENLEARTDGSGAFSAALPVGTYTARFDAPSYLNKEVMVDVVEGQDRNADFVVRTRPGAAGVQVAATGITFKQAVKFKKASADLDPESLHVLDEVVDALVNHPELRKVKVEAHWDSSLKGAKADELTAKQANAVRDYIVSQGVAASRVEAAGLGSSKPLVPNIGAANKAKNRRIEITTSL